MADIARIKDTDTREVFTEMAESITDGIACHALLLGPAGFGKTHAMMALGAALVDRGMPVRQIVCGSEQQLLVPRPGDFNNRSVEDLLDENVRVVLLDEFSRGQWVGKQGDGTETYRAFLDRVKALDLSLIVTANFTRGLGTQAEGALEAAVSPVVFSRLWALMDQETLSPGELVDGKPVDQRRAS